MRGRPTCPLRVLSALAACLMLSAASSFAQTNDLQQMLIQATGLAASGETEQARALFQQLITTAPDTVYAGHAHLRLAKLHIAALTTAVSLAHCAADLAGMSADELWEHAEHLRTDGDITGAKQAYQAIVEHHPDNEGRASWALYRLCSLSYTERDIPTALSYIQRVINDYPESGICTRGYAASYLTAIYLIFLKDHETGIEIGEDHLARFGPRMASFERANTVERLAKCYVAADEPANAVEALEENAILYPDLLRRPQWYQTLFDVRVAQKDYMGALSTARAAYALCDFDQAAIQRRRMSFVVPSQSKANSPRGSSSSRPKRIPRRPILSAMCLCLR